MFSHVQAGGERHYDWFTLILDGREIALFDDRNRSARIHVTLAPGEVLEHEIDLARWTDALGRELSARYVVEPEAGFWSGTLTAGPVARAPG